jgi:hypothetical protein
MASVTMMAPEKKLFVELMDVVRFYYNNNKNNIATVPEPMLVIGAGYG